MNKQIKSHWRLAYKAVAKAVKVTFSVIIETIKAKKYIFLNEERLYRERLEYEKEYQLIIDRMIDESR